MDSFNDRDHVLPSVWAGLKKAELKVPGSIDVDKLLVIAGSVDPEVRLRALDQLDKYWNSQPMVDANDKEVIVGDLLEEIEKLPEKLRKDFLENLVAIELTRGCNGGCFFCNYGRKRGVTHKFNFVSIGKFLDKYGSNINEDAKWATLHLNSDPLDYKDGSKRFVDVYRLAKEKCPKIVEHISTALPPGTEKDFINLVLAVVDDHFHDTNISKIRVSISTHNAKRIEATLKVIEAMLTTKFSKGGMNGEEVTREVLNSLISIDIRSDEIGIKNVGSVYKKQENGSDLSSPVCNDGTVLSVDQTRCVAMVASTSLDTSGQIDLPVENHRVITRDSLWSYLVQEGDYKRLKEHLEYNSVLMQPIVMSDGTTLGEISPGKEISTRDLEIYLSRQAVSIHYGLELLKNFLGSDSTSRNALLDALTKQYNEKKLEVVVQVGLARKQIEEKDVAQLPRYDYLESIWNLNVDKMDLILGICEKKEDLGEKRMLARSLLVVLDQIGLDTFENIPKIMKLFQSWIHEALFVDRPRDLKPEITKWVISTFLKSRHDELIYELSRILRR